MKSRPFLILFFAVVAALGLGSIWLGATVERAEKTVTKAVSPDGRMKAVRISLAMKGDKPFCIDSIAVLLAVYPDMFAEKNKAYEVYVAPCAAPDRSEALPRMTWTTATTLRIEPPAQPAGGTAPVRKFRDVTKTVGVTFAPPAN